MDGQRIADIKTAAEAVPEKFQREWTWREFAGDGWVVLADAALVESVYDSEELAQYIAAVNPPAVAALVAALEEAQRERTEWRRECSEAMNDLRVSMREAKAAQQRLDAVGKLCDDAESRHREVWEALDDYADIGDPKGPFPGDSQVSVDKIRAVLSVPVVSPATTKDEK